MDKTKPEVSEQPEDVSGISTDLLCNFLQLLFMIKTREEREEREKNASQ